WGAGPPWRYDRGSWLGVPSERSAVGLVLTTVARRLTSRLVGSTPAPAIEVPGRTPTGVGRVTALALSSRKLTSSGGAALGHTNVNASGKYRWLLTVMVFGIV